MNRIDAVFKKLRKQKKVGFIPFITIGDPLFSITENIIYELEKVGADIIELGIPFSDPLADGPTIQSSSQRALKNEFSLLRIFNLIKEIRKKINIPLVFLSYFNPIYNFGVEEFITMSSKVGIDGIIVPDLIIEEASDWIRLCKKNRVASILLVSPTTLLKRVEMICQKTTGFLYYVTLTGVTGARKSFPYGLVKRLKKLRKICKKPLACGFGISNRNQVKQISKYTDAVIVGSALIDVLQKTTNKKEIFNSIKHFKSQVL